MTTLTNGACQPTRRTSPTRSAEAFVLTLWTGDRGLAAAADAAGVQRIGVDLERLGKRARQKTQRTWISPHRLEDLTAIHPALRRAQSFARVNGIQAESRAEIERVLAIGVGVVMAPMIGSRDQACAFAELVGGRARTVALVETRQGMDHLSEIAGVPGIDEVHIGINDLSLSLDLQSRWAVLTGTLLHDAAICVRSAGKPFGFGAIARPGDERLPLPSDLVYAEYARVGATRALIARSFCAEAPTLATDVAAARARLDEWRAAPADALATAHAALERRVAALTHW